MQNRTIFYDIKHLKQFIELYKQCKNIDRLTKFNNEEKKIFALKSKGLPIKFGCTKKLIDFIPQREGLYHFWQENKYFWLIPLETSCNNVYGFIVRGYIKNYNVFRITNELPVIFGYYDFNDFDFYKQPIILTEGVKDALVIKTIYPYTLSLNTAGLSTNCFEFLKNMTNKFILMYDNDDSGREAAQRDKNILEEAGKRVIDLIPTFKDFGKYINYPSQLELLNLIIKQYI